MRTWAWCATAIFCSGNISTVVLSHWLHNLCTLCLDLLSIPCKSGYCGHLVKLVNVCLCQLWNSSTVIIFDTGIVWLVGRWERLKPTINIQKVFFKVFNVDVGSWWKFRRIKFKLMALSYSVVINSASKLVCSLCLTRTYVIDWRGGIYCLWLYHWDVYI